MVNNSGDEIPDLSKKRDFFGHPRGLSTLFFTELWERFSYYGMRALLVLYMTAKTVGHNPGLGYDVGKAAAIYGLYTFFVYVLSLPGGWVADKLWGQRKTVFVGGCIIAAGHFSMAIPTNTFFFIGLILIVGGTGLLKPNVSTMVGSLYPEGGARRDAGFSVFYMGINFGAILGPLLVGILGEGYSWHLGFSLAGVGMLIGLITYKIGGKYLGKAGLLDSSISDETIKTRGRKFWGSVSVGAAIIVLFGFLMSSGAIGLTLKGLAGILGVSVILIITLFFAVLIFNKKWTIPVIAVAVVVFILSLPYLNINTFKTSAQQETADELTQMIKKDRINKSDALKVAGSKAQRLGNLQGDEVETFVQGLNDAQVRGLMHVSNSDLNSLAREKRYIAALQYAIAAAFIFFILLCVARLLLPNVEVSSENQKLMVIFWLFILAALFWAGFEQAGSSLNLFAKKLTDRTFGPSDFLASGGAIVLILILAVPTAYLVYRVFKNSNLWSLAKWVVGVAATGVLGLIFWILYSAGTGWTTPASTLQLINPTFIVILAPVFGTLWTWLANRNANPSIPVKFALGLLALAAGFFVVSWGAAQASAANKVTPAWLVVTYFLHTCGELSLSPVGLSSMTKLAPKGRTSQMMGIWFVAAALGNLIAGLVAGQLESLAPSSLFWSVALIVGGGGIVALLASPFVKKLMGDVK